MLIRWAVSLLLVVSAPAFGAEVWKVTSLDWPPFSGKDLPDGGSGIKALREALASQGIELQVEFFPWSRAVETARQPGYAGVFPAWPEDADAAGGFSKSKPLFTSALVIAVNKEAGFELPTLADLSGKTVAVVQDYGNTQEFNDLVAAGAIKADVSPDDLSGLKKLEIKRVAGMIIDVNVMRYLLHTRMPNAVAKIEAAKGWREEKDLLLAISDTHPDKARLLQVIEQASSAVNGQDIVDAANKRIFGTP